ncbi:MAG: ATP-binding cassette domain-containing protein [Nitrososphaerota archaeon]|jgi:ABC-2 type transport system ATP-binding protein|uniref:ABC transporter ATP-binding protein n=1 Tax=Candidatus Bathycorpusculum sp. TaxID=2994959 RepID=UPI0028307263|nr:ATP-binding cassette domain-containing protein [Candidatus Termitimicrobium sp.]MCL2432604.1 ATP-binding cassette domain-containing protein [Candidatus Termitimicrobium sp.]MDR0493329.1 ATP-binding cassette domain-containing protein [Nitrososphaerota archaeon]
MIPADNSAIVIEVKNLVKRYKGAKAPSVDDISFSVKKGEFFAFLGPNGAGKTTTISILTTTLGKTSGDVKIAGFDIDKQAQEIREKVGIIFQKPSLDRQLTAEENIRFHACLYGMCSYRPTFKLMPKAYRDKVIALAEVMGLSVDALFKPVRKLSGGMQRKLEIVRSLIHTPDVLFLDEPTQGLDAVSRRGLWAYINSIRNQFGTTIFLTTHYIDEAENADNVCIINNGKVIACSSPDELKKSLLKQELILDSQNRNALMSELSALNLSYTVAEHVIVPYTDSPQEIITQLKTKLSVLKIHEPLLEDAYIEFLNKTNNRTEA